MWISLLLSHPEVSGKGPEGPCQIGRGKMLWVVFSLLLLLWLLFGLASPWSASIHLLLVAAVIILILNILSRRKPAV